MHSITYAIEHGKTLALVGESGCGKSLTAFTILRLLPPTASWDRAFRRADAGSGHGARWRSSSAKPTIPPYENSRMAMRSLAISRSLTLPPI